MMLRLRAEIFLVPLLFALLIIAYFLMVAEERRAQRAVIVESHELALSAPRFLLDFSALESAAHRAVLGDPSLGEGEFSLRLDIAASRIEALQSDGLTVGLDANIQEKLRRVLALSTPIREARFDETCAQKCQAETALRQLPLLKRELSKLQTSALKLDNKLHEAKDNAISNGIATLKQLTLAVIVVGLIIAGYLFIRYRQTIEHTRELEESHARLLQLSDFRANFLAGMSHEFRTPLNAIKGFSELALMMGEKVPRAQINEYMQDINKAVSNLEHLINNILDLSRIDSGAIDLVPGNENLSEVVDAVISQLVPDTPSRERFDVHIDPALTLECDPNCLRRCLDNLLSNSIKYSEPNTPIKICALRRNGSIEISVADAGQGIADDDLDKVWEIYARSSYIRSNAVQGTGVGLSLVKSLVEAHHGTVRIESRLGKGTTVFLSFPEKFEQSVRRRTELAA